ncbi:hypothetical protein QFZ70_000301 [Arthrobacter sp. V1I9]|uniref:hypothetical protein n=1 Tax=Arthrobacter sp. V1I9 TaxID=3042275 RepID=UPI002790AB52|nr:hypothetical protein [Arthrobacter sp. V1I9]MDQ0867828.1 hypothetical protein [Arthrobacter sp. V1I9]
MNSSQSSADQFTQYLKTVRGAKYRPYRVTEQDTTESVVSGLRLAQQSRGCVQSEPFILRASARVLISRRNERQARSSRAARYQLDIHHSASNRTREAIPVKDLEDAKTWARTRIEAQGAEFAAIYSPALGSTAPGTGALVSSFNRSVGWYR